jgi:nitrite reductase/ring-hydroxylating ferredoxin subunit
LATQRIYKWHKLADADELLVAEGIILKISVPGKQLCITQNQGIYYAFQPKCPHAGADFEQGYLDEKNCLVCPLHRYRFDLASGRNVSGEGFGLVRHPIEARDTGIWVGILEEIW